MHKSRNERAAALLDELHITESRAKVLEQALTAKDAEIARLNNAVHELQQSLDTSRATLEEKSDIIRAATASAVQAKDSHEAACKAYEARIAALQADLQTTREHVLQNDYYRNGYNKLQLSFDDERIGKVLH